MKLSSLILFVLILASCQESNTRNAVNEKNELQKIVTPSKNEFNVYEWEYKEHTYIVIDRAHGSGITHAGHCRCNPR